MRGPRMGVRAAVEAQGLVGRFGAVQALAGVDPHLAVGGVLLAGPVSAGAVRNLFVLASMTAVAHAIGFRFHAGRTAAVAAIGLALAVGVAFSWLFALLGRLVRDPESAGIGGLLAGWPVKS